MGLDGVELIMGLESEFDISISDAQAAVMLTPRDTVICIMDILDTQGKDVPLKQIENAVKRATIENLGISEQEYSLDARYVEDLGLQ